MFVFAFNCGQYVQFNTLCNKIVDMGAKYVYQVMQFVVEMADRQWSNKN